MLLVLMVALIAFCTTALHLRGVGQRMLADADARKAQWRGQREHGTPCAPVCVDHHLHDARRTCTASVGFGRAFDIYQYCFVAIICHGTAPVALLCNDGGLMPTLISHSLCVPIGIVVGATAGSGIVDLGMEHRSRPAAT